MRANRLTAALVIGRLLLASDAVAQPTDPPPCGPTALISGEQDVVAQIDEQLAAAGVSRAPSEACPAVTATVARVPDGILVRIEDPSGRVSERTVSGPEAAAALIESWTRSDVSLALLDGRAAPPAPPAPVAAPPVPPASGGDAPAGPVARIGIGAEVAAGVDGSSWFGGRLAGCGAAGPTCVGALLRGADDPGLSGGSADRGTRRGGGDLLLTVDLPVRWERFALVPGVGVGGGWLRSSGSTSVEEEDEEGEHEGENDDDGDEDETAVARTRDSFGLRIDAHLGGAVRLGEALVLELVIGVGWSTHGHREVLDARGAELAGEPAVLFRGGVGLGYEL